MDALQREKASKFGTWAWNATEYLDAPEEAAACLDLRPHATPGDIAGVARAPGGVARAMDMSLVAREASV